jgi:hypothetical protein
VFGECRTGGFAPITDVLDEGAISRNQTFISSNRCWDQLVGWRPEGSFGSKPLAE